jgi:hypothetical protein
MSSDVFWLLVGAAIGAAGAILGGFVQGLASDWFERRRAAAEKHEQWIQTALEWAASGRTDSLRRANLQGADLRWVDLGPGEGVELGEQGADLVAANLTGTDLRDAILTRADLTGANLKGAHLEGADLKDANLTDASLTDASLTDARYDKKTQWPDGFTPPPEAIKVEDDSHVSEHAP